MLKNSDGAGVIGNLAWNASDSTSDLSDSLHGLTPPPDKAATAVRLANAGVNCFTINVAHEKAFCLPSPKHEPVNMQDRAGVSGEMMKEIGLYLCDIANIFIFGFSRYAECLVRSDLNLKKRW